MIFMRCYVSPSAGLGMLINLCVLNFQKEKSTCKMETFSVLKSRNVAPPAN